LEKCLQSLANVAEVAEQVKNQINKAAKTDKADEPKPDPKPKDEELSISMEPSISEATGAMDRRRGETLGRHVIAKMLAAEQQEQPKLGEISKALSCPPNLHHDGLKKHPAYGEFDPAGRFRPVDNNCEYIPDSTEEVKKPGRRRVAEYSMLCK